MSKTKYITIKEAAELAEKSVQTIRRMIKSKKVKFRKDKTPQGFNYLIDLDSLIEYYKEEKDVNLAKKIDLEPEAKAEVVEPKKEEPKTEMKKDSDPKEVAVVQDRQHHRIVNYEPVQEFNDTIQKLIDQHGKEKENLFKLIESFQNKVINLENKVKEHAGKRKKWFKLW